MYKRFLIAFVLATPAVLMAQARGGGRGAAPVGPPTLLVPDRVWDAVDAAPHEGWVVLVRGDRIEAVGPRAQITVPSDATTIALPGTTLMPGMIEGHSHLLLHPYNEPPWNDQVLHESLALRVARAVNHARATLMAGFTSVRDLGTEGAGYADVGL
jgi:imidazolonepropionase-like amidohydrolase